MVRNPGIWQEAVNGVEAIFRVIQGMHAYTLSFCFHICTFCHSPGLEWPRLCREVASMTGAASMTGPGQRSFLLPCFIGSRSPSFSVSVSKDWSL